MKLAQHPQQVACVAVICAPRLDDPTWDDPRDDRGRCRSKESYRHNGADDILLLRARQIRLYGIYSAINNLYRLIERGNAERYCNFSLAFLLEFNSFCIIYLLVTDDSSRTRQHLHGIHFTNKVNYKDSKVNYAIVSCHK